MKGLIGCLRVPAFAAQIEARAMTGGEPPDALSIIIVDDERVTGASPALLAQGVCIGMTTRAAYALRANACFVAARPLRYREVANSAHACLLDFLSAVELDYRYPASDFYAYCDLGPVRGALATARRALDATLRRLDLVATCGVAANKYVAGARRRQCRPGK